MKYFSEAEERHRGVPLCLSVAIGLSLSVAGLAQEPAPAAGEETEGDSPVPAEEAPVPAKTPLEALQDRIRAARAANGGAATPANEGVTPPANGAGQPANGAVQPANGAVQPANGAVPPADATVSAALRGGGEGTAAAPVVANEPRTYSVELPNADITDIILQYEEFTGDHVIVDATAQGTVHIVSNPSRKMTKSEAVEFIKTSLLLNGFVIVPVQEGMVKLLNWSSKPPGPEGNIRTFTKPLDPTVPEGDNLPSTEEVINYIMPLTHVSAEEAVRLFDLAVPKAHAYGTRTPVPNAGLLVLTDNVPVIRSLIEVKRYIDIEVGVYDDKMVYLERADADEVTAIVQEILTARTAQRNNASGSGAPRGGGNNSAPAQNGANALAQALQSQANNQGATGGASEAEAQGIPDENSIIIQAVPRLNSILIFAMPKDIIWVEDLVSQLDSEAQFKKFLQRQLRFVPVVDFLGVASDTLARGQDVTTGGGGGSGLSSALSSNRGNTRTTSNSRTNSRTNSLSSGLNSRGTSGGLSNTGTSSGFGGGRSTGSSFQGAGESFQPPVSTIVGKTLLIADPQSNSLIVSGTPEHLTMIDELIDAIDKRPRQVYISAIIAQITLGDDIQYGVDLLRKVEQFDIAGTPVSAAGVYNTITNGTGIIDPILLDQVQGFTDTGIAAAGGFNTYAAVGDFLNAYIRALENTNKFKVLARPSVYTANNSPARLSSGTRIPVPTSQQSTVVAGGTTSLNSNISFEDVVLELNVTPLINSRDEVTLQVNQVNDSIAGFTVINNDQIPNISTQELETFVNVPSGSVVVIGGLIQESESKTTAGLPIISKIPLLKHLTGSNTTNRQRTELLVFIQPIVIDNTADLIDLNIDEVRRTMLGKEVEPFSKPAYGTDGVVEPRAWEGTRGNVVRPSFQGSASDGSSAVSVPIREEVLPNRAEVPAEATTRANESIIQAPRRTSRFRGKRR